MSSILVINDDPVQLHLLTSLLEQDQYDVQRFACSESAWEWLQEGQVPDAIVLDLHMPGISGWRFCELLHSRFGQGGLVPPILAVSATYSGPDAEDMITDLGASAFLALPTEPSYFRQQVRRLVEGHARPKPLQTWLVSTDESEYERVRRIMGERGWHVIRWHSGRQIQSAMPLNAPDIVIIDAPLSDLPSEDFWEWCKHYFPHALCIQIGQYNSLEGNGSSRGRADICLPSGCDPLTLISLCEKGRWERTLSRVEHLLEVRTSDLRESEAQFKGLFDILPAVLVIYDAHHIIKHINAAGAQQLSVAAEALIGQPLSRIYLPECESITSPKNDDGIRAVSQWDERVLVGKDGVELQVEIMERPVRFQGQRHTLLVARDITVRKRMEQEKATLEQQLRQVQKMEAIGRLASGVAHDMNNILTAILGHASLLKVRAEESQTSWKAGDVIEKAVHRGKELTSQLLGFARQGKHHHVPVDIHVVIQEVIGLLGRTITKRINSQANLKAETPAVVGDPNQLYQVFMNLAVNACDAMGKSGELLFGTTNECVTPEQASHVPGLSAGDYVVVRVTDTGEGISQEIQGKIFEPFFTTKDQGQGSGMGLAMVYGIVKNHQGYIGVTSTQGVGTTMRIYLPVSSSGLSQAEPTRNLKPSHGTGHVLVVDDEKEVAEAAQAILEYLGYDATVVLTGEEAVAYCQQSELQVDMILLDMVMPDMTGTECFSRLRAIRPEAKVVLCTGYDRNHAVQELLNQGVAGFIQKPYDLDELAKICAEVIKQETKSSICLTGSPS